MVIYEQIKMNSLSARFDSKLLIWEDTRQVAVTCSVCCVVGLIIIIVNNQLIIHHVNVARKLWRDYFASGVDGVVFIVDAVDRARFPEAKKELDVRVLHASVVS